jgi:hypothetical protein
MRSGNAYNKNITRILKKKEKERKRKKKKEKENFFLEDIYIFTKN